MISNNLKQKISYPFRLTINALRILKNYGLMAVFAKAKDVAKKFIYPEKTYDHDKAFQKWLKKNKPNKKELKDLKSKIKDFDLKPRVSILVPVYNPDKPLLEALVESIYDQIYENWELCLSDDDSREAWVKEYMQELADKDERVKIQFNKERGHITGNTNRCAKISTGDYFVLADNDDLLPPDALYRYIEKLNEKPKAQLIYGDEYKLTMEGVPVHGWFRSEHSPEIDLAMSTISHFFMSKEIFNKVGGFVIGTEGAQDYDLANRITENTNEVYHIPYMTYIWRMIPGSTAVEFSSKDYAIINGKKAVERAAERRGIKGQTTGDMYPFRFEPDIIGNPSAEIIIPNKDHIHYLKICLKSISRFTKYTNFTVTIVDNRSVEDSTYKYYEKLKSQGVKILHYNKPYNFAAMNNLAATKSKADYLVFMNNDIKIVRRHWLKELISWAQLPEIGPVGTELIYPSGRVQHAGIVFGVGGIANSAFWNELESSMDYFNQKNLIRNYSAVTAALMCIGRKKFLSVGGFDEINLPINYQDLDLCLKLNSQKALRTVYTPYAKAIHFESVSRDKTKKGRVPDDSEVKYFKSKWQKIIDNDPYYNQHFERGDTGEGTRTFRLPEQD